MKILYLHQYFNTPTMPGGSRSYEMARRLVSWGHEVEMVTSDRSGSKLISNGWYKTIEAGIRVHWLRVPYSNNMGYKKRIESFIFFAYKAAQKAVSLKADIVFATSTPLTIAIPAIFASKKLRIPMVFEVRDLWPELPIAIGVLKNPLLIQLTKRFERYVYNYSSRIIALSPGMKEGIIKVGCDTKKITVIPNSCDLETFNIKDEIGNSFRSGNDWLGDRPLVVYTGTIGLMNGVDYLVRLAVEVNKLDCKARFLIVGKGKDEEKVKSIAMQLGVLNKNLFMLSAVAKKEIPQIINAADVVISLFIDVKEMWNNSANKFFDALAASRPMAINYQGWQADILRSSGAGIVLDAKDISKAACDLVAVLHDKEWLRRAREASGKIARRDFSRDLLAKKLEGVLIDAMRS